MTREAYQKLVKFMTDIETGKHLDVLEALGLLKFDEFHKFSNSDIYRCGITESNLLALDRAGYHIIETCKISKIDYKDGTRIIY